MTTLVHWHALMNHSDANLEREARRNIIKTLDALQEAPCIRLSQVRTWLIQECRNPLLEAVEVTPLVPPYDSCGPPCALTGSVDNTNLCCVAMMDRHTYVVHKDMTPLLYGVHLLAAMERNAFQARVSHHSMLNMLAYVNRHTRMLRVEPEVQPTKKRKRSTTAPTTVKSQERQ